MTTQTRNKNNGHVRGEGDRMCVCVFVDGAVTANEICNGLGRRDSRKWMFEFSLYITCGCRIYEYIGEGKNDREILGNSKSKRVEQKKNN